MMRRTVRADVKYRRNDGQTRHVGAALALGAGAICAGAFAGGMPLGAPGVVFVCLAAVATCAFAVQSLRATHVRRRLPVRVHTKAGER